MTLETWTTFLGWCTLINFGMLILSTVVLRLANRWVVKTHQKWFDLPPEDLQREYFRYLAQFKLLVLIFNLTPYVALSLISAQQ